MKHFSRARGRLGHLPLPARIVYATFLAFTLAGMAMSAWLADDMVGLDLRRAETYYAGGAADVASPAARTATDGPQMDLPPELDTPAVSDPIPLRKLLEVTHFHLFSMPLYLLVLSHLFMLTGIGERAKVAWIAIATASVAGHIAAPWLVRAGLAASTLAYGLTGAAMAISLGVMATLSLWEMFAPVAVSSDATPS